MKKRNPKLGVTRIQSADELTKRRFHSDVRKLRKLCATNAINLADFDEAEDDWVCIISDNDYEIGALKHDCSPDSENYFVSNDALIVLHKITNEYDDIS